MCWTAIEAEAHNPRYSRDEAEPAKSELALAT